LPRSPIASGERNTIVQAPKIVRLKHEKKHRRKKKRTRKVVGSSADEELQLSGFPTGAVRRRYEYEGAYLDKGQL